MARRQKDPSCPKGLSINDLFGYSVKPPLTLFTALLLAPLAVLHAADPISEENSAAKQWAQSHVFAKQVKLPFSFVLGGKSSEELLRDWKQTEAAR